MLSELRRMNCIAMEDAREKSILQSHALLEYIFKTSAYPKEHELLRQLREATIEKYKSRSIMNVAIDEAQFIAMLLKLINAKKTLEVGVFTGYSLLTAALALPEDGKITAIDPDREAYETGLPFIKRAGVEHKINFINLDGETALNDLLNSGKEGEGTYDFILMDVSDKGNYINFHDSLLKLVKVGGVIAYDDTLLYGSVALPDDHPHSRKYGGPLLKLNDYLAGDSRIESVILSIGDGLTLCRRL